MCTPRKALEARAERSPELLAIDELVNGYLDQNMKRFLEFAEDEIDANPNLESFIPFMPSPVGGPVESGTGPTSPSATLDTLMARAAESGSPSALETILDTSSGRGSGGGRTRVALDFEPAVSPRGGLPGRGAAAPAGAAFNGEGSVGEAFTDEDLDNYRAPEYVRIDNMIMDHSADNLDRISAFLSESGELDDDA